MSDTEPPTNWMSGSAAILRRLGDSAVEPSVREWLKGHEGARLLAACSGGPDSVFALCLLWALRAEFGIQLVVAHYNHRWRGEDSDADAAFTVGIADALGVGCVVESRPEKEAAFTETAARELRLGFLRRAAAENDCAAIVLGHQRDDILETQLIRLSRGSGSDGLAAPRPVNYFPGYPDHLRPILHLRAGDVRMTLKSCGLAWRTDASNDDLRIQRNGLRHEAIPILMEFLDRDVQAGAARSRALLEEDAAALAALAAERLPGAFTSADSLDRATLRGQPRAIARRALTAWLGAHQLLSGISAQGFERLIDSIYADDDSSRHSVGGGFVCIDGEAVSIDRNNGSPVELPAEGVALEMGETVILPTMAQLSLELCQLDRESSEKILAGSVDASSEAYLNLAVGSSLFVRAWEAGDRFKPLGAPGTRKVKDWFIDRKVPVKERKRLPIVTNEDGMIVWIPGFPPAEDAKLGPDQKQALRLTYHRTNPL